MNKITSSRFFQKIRSFVVTHKIWTLVIVAILVFVGYKVFGGNDDTVTRYVESAAAKGTVVVSISGSGQVSASSHVDLQSQSSGEVTYVGVKAGDTVKKGKTLFSINAQSAEKAVRDTTLALEIARNDLADARRDYEDTKVSENSSLQNLMLNLNSDVIAVPDDTNSNTNIVTLSGSYNSVAQGQYTLSVYACEGIVCVNYTGLESGAFPIDVNVPKALGTQGLYVTFSSLPRANEKWYIDVPSPSSKSYLSNLRSYNEREQSSKKTLQQAEATIVSRELSVRQKENALTDARQALSDYYVTAPFDGTIATVGVSVGTTASGTLGSIITHQKIATITLNEVDVAKIALSDKATLTFDAIEDLSIAGEVVSIDPVGTVTQGVVNYTVKISFASEDERVKPGMSVTAAIVAGIAQDVLTIPASAVKVRNGISYVEMFDSDLPEPELGTQGSLSETPPREQEVEVGLSDDTTTEIISGLAEGDKVVSRTITTSGKSASSAAPSATSLLGGQNRGGGTTGGATFRAIGR
ncbi:MAG: efflux RND transporter periplasmic adaptor subunit [Patescibacteria group bacterium]